MVCERESAKRLQINTLWPQKRKGLSGIFASKGIAGVFAVLGTGRYSNRGQEIFS